MPLTKNAQANKAELDEAHPEWSEKRRWAASLNAARSRGADIPEPDDHTKRVARHLRKRLGRGR